MASIQKNFTLPEKLWDNFKEKILKDNPQIKLSGWIQKQMITCLKKESSNNK